jgi:DNA-binding beta-propeller fold protein YncE
MRLKLRATLVFSLLAALAACGSSTKPPGGPTATGGGGGSGGSTGGGGGTTPPTGGAGGMASADSGATTGGSPGTGGAATDGAAPDTAAPTPDGPSGPAGPAKIVLVAGGGNGGDGMPATMASLNQPYGITTDPMTGEVYVSEMKGNKVRRIDTMGMISTVVGAGAKAPNDLTLNQPHDALFQPGTRILFVADTFAGRVIRYDVVADKAEVFAGKGTPLAGGAGTIYSIAFSPDGKTLYFTSGGGIEVVDIDTKTAKPAIGFGAGVIAVDSKGTLYAFNGRNAAALSKIDSGGKATTVAGSNGLHGPKDLAIDPQDNPVIADTEGAAIRKLDIASGMLSVIAGNGTVGKGTLDGPPQNAQLARPHGVFVDGKGTVFIADSENNRVLRIDH